MACTTSKARLYARASNDIDHLPHLVISPGKHPFHPVHKSESNRTLLLVVHSGDELQLILLCMLPIKNTVAAAITSGTCIYIHSKLEERPIIDLSLSKFNPALPEHQALRNACNVNILY